MLHNPPALQFSIIIPVFNGADHLECIWDCLLKEALGNNVNIIFVDDGSTDSTRNYLDVLTAENSNCRYIRLEENCGQAAARNIGICCAKSIGSDFITFLDVDDKFEPGYVNNLLSSCTNEADVLVGSFVSVFDNLVDPFNGRSYLLDDFSVIDSQTMLWLLSNDRASVSPCNKLIRLSKCPSFPLGVKEEDTLWAFSLFSNKNLLVSRCHGPSYKYMIHLSSSTRKFDLRIFDSFWIMKEVGALLRNNSIEPLNFYYFWVVKVIGARFSGLPFFLMLRWMPVWFPRIMKSDISLYWKWRTVIRIIYRSVLNLNFLNYLSKARN